MQKELQNDTVKAVAENVDETVTNSQGGSFHFGELTYTHPGTYIYQVSEVQEGKAGYTYDSHVATVKVVVTGRHITGRSLYGRTERKVSRIPQPVRAESGNTGRKEYHSR